MKLRHAIIGCGHIAPSHVYGCNKNKVVIASCCDLEIEKAKNFAQTHHIKTATNSIEEILADKSIDTVSICTDHKSHAPLAIKALESGKNVIVEKPMALSVADAKKMLSIARKNKKVLAVVSQHRYNRVIMEIKKALTAEKFGKITLVNATLNCQKAADYYTKSYWKGTWDREGGSALINQAIHTLDLVTWIKGLPVEVKSYFSTLKFKGIIETEDTLASLLLYKDASLTLFSVANTSIDIWDSKIEIIGTKGTITFSADYPVKVLHLIHEDKRLEKSLRQWLESYADKFTEPPPVSYYGTKHREQMGDFFKVVSGKSKGLFMKPEEALRTLSVVMQIYQAGRENDKDQLS